MALPTKKINKVTLPGDVNGSKTYDIVPEMLGKDGYSAELPTLTANSTIALNVSLTTTTDSEAITVGSDSLNLVTRDTAQTITANKIFKNASPLTFEKADGSKDYYVEWINDALAFRRTGMSSGQFSLKLDGYTAYIYNLQPAANNAYDIGTSNYRFNDIYLGGTGYIPTLDSEHLTLTNYSSIPLFIQYDSSASSFMFICDDSTGDNMIFTNESLSTDRTYIFPDKTGVIAITDDLPQVKRFI